MQFIDEKRKDDHFHSQDSKLLMLSNYLYNNIFLQIQSPHFKEIYDEINTIAPDFVSMVAIKYRPLVNRSAVLGEFDIKTKRLLISVLQDYFVEIETDSKFIANALVEQEDNFQYINHTQNIEDIVHDTQVATKEVQDVEILNLLEYLKAFKNVLIIEQSEDDRMIFREIKMFCPGILSKIGEEGTEDILGQLNEQQRERLFVIARTHDKVLNEYRINTKYTDDYSEKITLIKALSEYLNYATFYFDAQQEESPKISISAANKMIKEIKHVSPQLKNAITNEEYEDTIDEVISNLSEDEVTQLVSLANRYREEIEKISPTTSEIGDETKSNMDNFKFSK